MTGEKDMFTSFQPSHDQSGNIVFGDNGKGELLGLVSTKYARQSTEGDPHDGRLIGGMREMKNKKATETEELDRFGPSA